MNHRDPRLAQQIAEAASAYQKQSSGHKPKAVTVVLSEDTLVITLHEALTPAEKALTTNAAGANQVQEFHRQLFAASSESLRKEIHRITGKMVREATAEIEPTTGAIVHAFTTGTMVQVFLLECDPSSEAATGADPAQPAGLTSDLDGNPREGEPFPGNPKND